MATRQSPIRLSLLPLLGTLALLGRASGLYRWACDRVPDSALGPPKIGDGGYEVKVLRLNDSREASELTPGAEYSILVRNRFPSVTFTDFFLVAVRSDAAPKAEQALTVGQFRHEERPAATQSDPDCPAIATAVARGRRLASVRLRWTAPARPPACVAFRTTVEYVRSEYFKDADRLTKELCQRGDAERRGADVMMSDGLPPPPQPPPARRRRIERCCACGHAVYRMEVKGLWTRHNHPRDFPSDVDGHARARWTSIIGATHSPAFGIFFVGGTADPGVVGVCARGDTTPLESQFKDKGGWRILNVIKTHGLWGEDSLDDSRTALFSVNSSHHLLSFVTKLLPSPDWCAGVDDLDLCQANCTWKKELRLPLVPWDAGVRTGDTYQPEASKEEFDPIAFIGDGADFKRGPFETDPTGRALPAAELRVTRTRPTYDWTCDADRPQADTPSGYQDQAVAWSSQRKQQERQVAAEYPEMKEKFETRCMVSPWSVWSACSRTCGHLGFRTRERRQEITQPNRECDKLYNLTETESCGMSKISCEDTACQLTSWSNWTGCNAQCDGAGTQRRQRSLLTPESCPRSRQREIEVGEVKGCWKFCLPKDVCHLPLDEGTSGCGSGSRTTFYFNMRAMSCFQFEHKGCGGNDNRFFSEDSCLRFCKHGVSLLPPAELAALTAEQDAALAGAGIERCRQPSDSGVSCHADSSGSRVRWYFDAASSRCQRFSFNGCGGNANRFESEAACRSGCRHLQASEPRDCLMSRWSQWSACSDKCGGHRRRHRQMLRAPVNGGQACGTAEERNRCPRCCSYTEWSSWSGCSRTCSFIGAPSLRERRRQRTTPEGEECTALTMLDRSECKQFSATQCPGIGSSGQP